MAESEWEKLWFAVFGAGLTIVVTLITGSSARWFRARSIKRGILAEMYELQYRVAAALWMVAPAVGKFDYELFNELSAIVEAYTGPEDKSTFMEALKLIREAPEGTRQEVLDRLSGTKRGTWFVIPPYSIRFFTAHQSELGLLSVKFQTKLLRVVTSLEMFNHLADASERLIERAYAAVDENRPIPEEPLSNIQVEIVDRSKVLLKVISDLPLDRRFRWPFGRK